MSRFVRDDVRWVLVKCYSYTKTTPFNSPFARGIRLLTFLEKEGGPLAVEGLVICFAQIM